MIVRISDLNDNPPVWVGLPYSVSLPESTPVNTTVYTGLRAEDKDTGANRQVCSAALTLFDNLSVEFIHYWLVMCKVYT